MDLPTLMLAIGLGTSLAAQEKMPTARELQRSASRAFEESRFRDAANLAKQGLVTEADDPGLLSMRAWSLLRLAETEPEELAAAGVAFDLAWKMRNPKSVNPRLTLGVAMCVELQGLVKGVGKAERDRLWSRAEALFLTLVSSGKHELDALEHLLAIYVRRGRADQALATGWSAIEKADERKRYWDEVNDSVFFGHEDLWRRKTRALEMRTVEMRKTMHGLMLTEGAHRDIVKLMTASIDAAEHFPGAYYHRGISRRSLVVNLGAAKDFVMFLGYSGDAYPPMQRDAIVQLRALGSHAKLAVDILLRIAGRDTCAIEVRCEAVTTLGVLGFSAKKARPLLRRLSNHADKRLASIARSAAVQIVKQPR